mgnify:CR=1 FL=1
MRWVRVPPVRTWETRLRNIRAVLSIGDGRRPLYAMRGPPPRTVRGGEGVPAAMWMLGAVVAVGLALEVWALCRVAADADDAMGLR